MRRTRAVIFDMDGVLIDSEPCHLESTNMVLSRYGAHLSATENEKYLGWNEAAYWQALVERFDLPEPATMLAELRHEIIVDMLKARVPVAPGVVDFLGALRERDVVLAVASSSDRAVIDHVLDKGAMASFFAAIAAGDEVTRSKPDPEIFLLAAQRLGIDPSMSIVFEDAPHGARGALDAGMGCVRVVTETTQRLTDFPPVHLTIEGFEKLDADTLLETVESAR